MLWGIGISDKTTVCVITYWTNFRLQHQNNSAALRIQIKFMNFLKHWSFLSVEYEHHTYFQRLLFSVLWRLHFSLILSCITVSVRMLVYLRIPVIDWYCCLKWIGSCALISIWTLCKYMRQTEHTFSDLPQLALQKNLQCLDYRRLLFVLKRSDSQWSHGQWLNEL